MTARRRSVWLLSMAMATGCLPVREEPLRTVKPDPFKPPEAYFPDAPKLQLTSASKEEALRVDIVGQKLMEKNRQATGLRPMIAAVGSPAPELFHRGTDTIYVSEGLSRKCKSEGELAAVLAYELGRMVAEREAIAPPETRQPERLPPQESRVGTDSGGPFGPPDGTRLAELARFEKEQPRRRAAPPPPDPMVLARTYLERAGYTAQDLDAVTPLLNEARKHVDVERQLIGGTPPVRPWGQ